MYKRLLQEEGNNSFSMPRAQVIMALNCNSESLWAFSIGLYFFQVTDYSCTCYSHKTCSSHSYAVWFHLWTLCDSQAGCCGAALWSRVLVGQKSGVGWARSPTAEQRKDFGSGTQLWDWNRRGPNVSLQMKSPFRTVSPLRAWLQHLSLSFFMTSLITIIWPNPNHDVSTPVQWSSMGQKAVGLSALIVSAINVIADWGKLYTAFLICWTSCLEGGVIFQLQENHEKEIFCCCLTDFHTDKWKQSMEVTSPRTSIFHFSRVKIPSLEWDQLYWETELEFRYLHWYGGLLHTAYRTCNQSCLDNTDISLSLWEPSQCDRLPVDSCSHICHTCNPNFESFFFHSKRWN